MPKCFRPVRRGARGRIGESTTVWNSASSARSAARTISTGDNGATNASMLLLIRPLLRVALGTALCLLGAVTAEAAGTLGSVTVSAQNGTLTGGTAGSVTFDVTGIRNNNGDLTITFDPPVFSGGTPAGVTSQFAGGAVN